MTAERHARISELFLAMVDLPPAQREAELGRACADDAELRCEVERMLAADRGTAALDSSIAETQLSAALRALKAPAQAGHPERIGGYEVLGVLGRGGMGTVYRARQAHPERLVALKVLSDASLPEELLRRFAFEARVLGRLAHPGIAQIYEAGIAEVQGREIPFFAMEMVQGRPLTDHAHAARLDVRGRLKLLLPVCDAVQHAHQKGVIHRDLKPANILVDESGRPKVLDFGVARVSSNDGQTTQHTSAGQLVGTVPYMSPEQVSGDPDLIDTRSDVYALGVIAFELLAGQLPHDLRNRSLVDAVQVIRDTDAPHLSTRNPACAGDVDTIVAKALAKDRGQRYASVGDFATDIQRFLDDQPILARPPSLRYQLRKFARRNRVLVGSSLVVVLLLVAGVAGTSFGLLRALAAGREMQLARDAAERQAAQTLAANHFLRRMLASANPLGEVGYGGRDVTVLEMLDAESQDIEKSFHGQPAVEAEVRTTLGTTYKSLQRFEDAELHLSKAVELNRSLYGDAAGETARANRELAAVYVMTGRKEGIGLLQQSLAIETQLAQGKPTRDLALAHSRLGWALTMESRHSEAERELRAALQMFETFGTEAEDERISALNNLARTLRRLQRSEEAEEMYRRVVDGFRALYGDEHARVAIATNNLAKIRYERGALDEAEKLYRECIAVMKRTIGEKNVYVSDVINNLAYIVFDRGEVAAAIELQREAIRIHEAVTGRDNRSFIGSLDTLAYFLHRAGQYDEAIKHFEESRDFFRKRNGPEDWGAVLIEFYVAECQARVALGLGPGRTALEQPPAGESSEEVALLAAFGKLRRAAAGASEPAVRQAARLMTNYYRDSQRPDRAAEYAPLTSKPAGSAPASGPS